jgi:hypothetical protein
MATANPGASRPRSRRRLVWLLAGLALVALLLAFFWAPLTGYAGVGSAYAARVACSCRYAGGRSLEDCEKDFEPGMEMVSLSEDAAAKSVTARFPLLASETATYREGWGCLLEKSH